MPALRRQRLFVSSKHPVHIVSYWSQGYSEALFKTATKPHQTYVLCCIDFGSQ